MARLGRVLNASIILIGAGIIWQEWRNPARGARATAPGGGGESTPALVLPTEEAAPAAAGAAPTVGGSAPQTPSGAAADPAIAPPDPADADGSPELAERQQAAAEARFSPAFPVEIDDASDDPTAGGGAGTAPGTEDTPAAGPGDATSAAGQGGRGSEASDAPTTRDFELAAPPARAAGPPLPQGAVPGDGTAVCPPDHPIKGNASSMIYHQVGQASYERTVAEYCFASVEAAEAAGYRPPRGRGEG